MAILLGFEYNSVAQQKKVLAADEFFYLLFTLAVSLIVALDELDVELTCLKGIIISMEIQVFGFGTDKFAPVLFNVRSTLFPNRKEIALRSVLCQAQLFTRARMSFDSRASSKRFSILSFTPFMMIKHDLTITFVYNWFWLVIIRCKGYREIEAILNSEVVTIMKRVHFYSL